MKTIAALLLVAAVSAHRLTLDPDMEATMQSIKDSETQLHKSLGEAKMLEQIQAEDKAKVVNYITDDFNKFEKEEEAEEQETLQSLKEAHKEFEQKNAEIKAQQEAINAKREDAIKQAALEKTMMELEMAKANQQ